MAIMPVETPTVAQTSTIPAVIYLRVSSLKQVLKDFDPEGYSIPVQRDVCTRYVEGRRGQVVAEFVDYGESARTAHRPQLKAMMNYIAEHHVSLVVFYDVSRLARNELDAFQLLESIEATGARLDSATESIDTNTPAGRLVFGILASAQAFRSRGDGEKVKAGLQRKLQSGGTPGVAPLGYLNVIQQVNGRQV